MSFITTRNGCFSKDGKPWVPVGINYLPHYICGNWFEDWREDEILKDLDKMAELKLNSVRTPVFWSYFEPQPHVYNFEYIDKYHKFIGFCRKRGIYVMPFFLVGICTNFFPPPYSFGDSMYEGEMLELEIKHLQAFARHFADEPQIFLWDLSDEPYYIERVPGHDDPDSLGYRAPSKRDVAVNWVGRLAAALREVDPNHPITIGFDNSSIMIYNGFENEELKPHLDVMSHCLYLCPSEEETAVNLYPAFTTRLYDVGLPVFLHEGPGIPQTTGEARLVEGRYRTGIYGSVAAGNCGIMPWCFTDYDEEIRDRGALEEQPHEAVFGILEPDRTEKLQAEILRGFAEFAASFDWENYSRSPDEAVLVYPERFYRLVNQQNLFAPLFFNYLCLAGCGINTDLCREDAPWENFPLAVLPVPGLNTSSTWARARSYVQQGGRLLITGPKINFPAKAELLGLEIKGWKKTDPKTEASLDFSGSTAGFPMPEVLPLVETGGASVLASAGGLPVVFSNNYGQGTALWSALNLGEMLSQVSLQSREASALLKLMLEITGPAKDNRLIRTATDWIEIRRWDHREKPEAVFFILNPGSDEIKADYIIDRRVKSLRRLDDNRPLRLEETVLQPWEVLIIKAELEE
jgi:cellulase (glycosyl hydrolase family 5)